MNINGGIISYDVSSGLLVDGQPISATQALYPIPYDTVVPVNNLLTVTDISDTLLNFVTSFNNFMNIFSSRALVVILSPEYLLLSPLSIGFILNGGALQTVNIPIGNYSLIDIINRLNAASSPTIVFTPSYNKDPNNYQNYLWTVRFDVSGGNSSIADGPTNSFYTSIVPTGSLTLLRYLGFTVDTSNNPFETYTLGTNGIYYSTVYNISGSYISTNKLNITVEYPNNLPIPDCSYNVSDPYSISFRLANISSLAKFLCINQTGLGYAIYPLITTTQVIPNLIPNTPYTISAFYLDNYNQSSQAVSTLTTPRIPAPTITVVKTFNSITLNWSQPYPGKVYRFELDASGTFITPPQISFFDLSYTYFPLLRNTRYVITVYSVDNAYRSAPTIIDLSTNILPLNAPTVSRIPNSNASILVTWPAITPGAVGTLYYRYADSELLSYPDISNALTSFTVTGLGNSGIFSCYLVYTDYRYNVDLSSSVTNFPFNSSFGFENLLANAALPLVLDNVDTFGIGYAPGLGSIWVGYAINKISFPQGITEISGNNVSFVARAYDIPTSSLVALYSSPPWKNRITLPAPISTSVVFDLSAGTTAYPELLFNTTEIILKGNTSLTTIILLEKVSGLGRVRFSTFENNPPNPEQSPFATALTYDGDQFLSNGFQTSLYGVVCQFTNTISVPKPAYTSSSTPYTITLQLTNLAPSQVSTVIVDISGVKTTYPNTQTTIVFSGLYPGTTYNTKVTYKNTFFTNDTVANLSTIPIPPPVNLTVTTLTSNTITLNWASGIPSRNYQFRLTASGVSITPPNTTISATTFTYASLVQNTQYTINVSTYDTSFNIFSAPVIVTPKTLLISVPSVVISRQANTNRKIQFTWSPSIPVGLFGYLYYTIGSTNTNVGPIPSGSSSYLLPNELNFTTNVSSYLNYRDGQNNNVTGSVTNFVYDPSFGFYNLSPNSPTPLSLNSATIGVGYVLPAAGSLWIGFKMNTVSFPQGITETTGNAVAIVANIYSIPTNSLSYVGGGLYNNPFVAPNTGTINLPSPVNRSYIYFLAAGATAYPTLSFGSTQTLTNPVTTNFSLVLLIQIVDGQGNVQFSTFENTPSLNIGSLATAITYDGRIFSNTLLGPSSNGSICQFSFQPVPSAPFPPLLQNGVTQPTPYTLQYILTNLSSYNSYVSLNGVLSPKGTATTIVLDGLIPVSQYNLVIYYADISGSSSYAVSATTSAVGSPSPLSITNLTFSTLTASWATVAYSGRNIRYVITNTGPFSPGTNDLATTTLPYTNLLNGSSYSISVYAYDVSYNSSPYWSVPVSQAVSTPALSVAITSINLAPNSNTSVRIQWAPALISGLTGTLFYTVGGVSNSNAITGSTVSFTIAGLSTVQDISAVVVYTDGNRNTVTSAPVTYQYDPSFGFSSRSSITPRLSLTAIGPGVGYVLPAGSPWINYSVRSISFPKGITETLGLYVALIANVYTVATTSLSGLYTGGGTVSGLTLSAPDTSSNIFFLEPSTTATPTLTFSSPITLLNNANTTIILLQIIDGVGNIQFSTFTGTSAEAAISISYVGTTLTNRFISGSGSGVICQFDLIPSPAIPVTPTITNLTASPNTISYSLTNLPSNTVNYVSMNNTIYSNGTLTAITITGLNSGTVYNIRFYYASGTTIYSTSVSYNLIKTISVVPPTNLSSSNITFNSFNLSWTAGPAFGTDIGYLLSGTGTNIISPGKTYDTNYIFSSLSSNTTYSNIKLYAYNVARNTAVSRWRDKSGNKRDMTNSGDVAYVFGPKPSIKFNSSYMFVNTPVNLQSYTLFVVSSCVPAIINQSLFAARPTGTAYSYTGPDSFDMYVDSDNSNKRMRFYYNQNVFLSQSIPSTSEFAMPLNLMTYTCTSSGSASSYYNGVAGSTGTSGARTNTAQGFAVGASWGQTQWVSSNTQANLYEVITYNTVISDIQRIATTLYLGRKWQLPGFTTLPAIITTPTSIPDLQIWYDGLDPFGNGSVPYDGTAITTWVNKASTGSQYNAVSLASYSPAVYSASLKGVQFNLTNFYSTEYPANPTAETIFIAFNNNSNVNNKNTDRWALLGGYTGARGFAAGRSPDDTAVSYLNIGVAWQAQTPVGSYTLGTTAIATGQVSGNTTFASVNGAAFTSLAGAGLPYTAGTKTFLGQQSGNSYSYGGCAMEILIYNRALSSTEIQQVQNYLMLKWGGATPTAVPSCQLWLDANDINTIITTTDASPDTNQSFYSEPVALPSNITTTSFPAVTSLTLANASNAYTSVLASWTPPLPARVTGTLTYVKNSEQPVSVPLPIGTSSFTIPVVGNTVINSSSVTFTDGVNTSTANSTTFRNYVSPMASQIASRIGVSPFAGTASQATSGQNPLLWRYRTTGYVYTPPVVGLDGTIYVGDIGEAFFWAFRPDGTLKWNVRCSFMYPGPAIDAVSGNIYTNDSQNIRALNASNGNEIWKRSDVKAGVSTIVIGPTGAIYVGTSSNVLALDGQTGATLWTFNTTGSFGKTGAAVGADGTIYIGSIDYKLYAIRDNGTARWDYATEADIIATPAVGTDGTIYFGSNDTYIYALTSAGALKWRYKTGAGIAVTPTIGPDGTVYVGSKDSNFYALTSTGTLKWTYSTEGGIYTSAVLDNAGIVYFGGGGPDTYLIALTAATGSLVWRYAMGSPTGSPTLAVDGTIYVGSFDYFLYAFKGYFNTNTPSVSQTSGTSLGLQYATIPTGYEATMNYSLNGGAIVRFPITTPTTTPISTNLEVWYDGADPLANGTLPANGASINTWKNKASTGTTYDAILLSTSPPRVPATYSLANKALLFTTAASYDTRYTSKPVSETVFIVFNTNGKWDYTKSRILANDDGGSRCITVGSSNVGSTEISNSVGMINQNNYYQVSTPANSYISNTTAVATFTVSGQGITTTASVNGTNKSSFTSSAGYYSNVTTRLGNYGSSAYEGYAMEILIYSRVLSDTEILTTQSYLYNKWFGGVPVTVTYPPQRINSFVLYKFPTGNYFFYSQPFIYGGGWATFQNNNSRTGYSPNTANVPTNPKWVFNAGTGTISSPLIDSNNNVLFSHSSGRVYSLKGSDGSIVWQANPGARSVSPPALDFNGNFYTATTAGTIVKMSGVTGSVLWTSTDSPGGAPWPGASFSITGGLTIDQTSGYIYFALSNGYVYALGKDGVYVWRSTYNDYRISTCSIDAAGTIYVGGTYYGEVDTYNASTGVYKGVYKTGNWFSGDTTFSTVIIGPDQSVYTTGNFSSGGAPLGRVTRYLQDGTVVYNYNNQGNLLAAGPALGTNGILYHIYQAGYVSGMTSTGGVAFSYNTGGVTVSTSLALDVNNNAYFGYNTGYLNALSPSGSLLWSYQLPNGDFPVGTPVIGRNGTIYIGSNAGYLYAL